MSVIATPTLIPDVLVIEPKVFLDERGYFFESFNENDFSFAVGKKIRFVQDNQSLSKKGVIRGLHYQINKAQGKLVRVCRGAVFDVVVDLRQSSNTFGQWVGLEISAENKKQLWIPQGFAHGFLVLSDEAEFMYKVTDYWDSASERCLLWCDSDLNISWPLENNLQLLINDKDQLGLSFKSCPKFVD